MKKLMLLVCLFLTGCEPGDEPFVEMKTASTNKIAEADNARVEISRIGVFHDRLAYGGERGIYIIKDSKTGREFIGISGIGISENGSHSTGKTYHSDER